MYILKTQKGPPPGPAQPKPKKMGNFIVLKHAPGKY